MQHTAKPRDARESLPLCIDRPRASNMKGSILPFPGPGTKAGRRICNRDAHYHYGYLLHKPFALCTWKYTLFTHINKATPNTPSLNRKSLHNTKANTPITTAPPKLPHRSTSVVASPPLAAGAALPTLPGPPCPAFAVHMAPHA